MLLCVLIFFPHKEGCYKFSLPRIATAAISVCGKCGSDLDQVAFTAIDAHTDSYIATTT
jgi:hypothetical protein